MPITLTSVADLCALPFDTLVDVRSPAEFAEDHVPGAINLPALSNEERARVGTIYKQDSPFKARKIGAALVARNVAAHLDGPLAKKDGGWRPLVYCWRGGQRSGSVAIILGQVGWRAETVAGGYKSWRRLVVALLQDTAFPAPMVVLDGNTGTAKTEVLARLAARGVQVIDLEGLANHRGSLFGHREGGQPAQKWFESQLAVQVAALDPARPVVVEAESSRIGAVEVPKAVWAAIRAAPRVRIAAPLTARADYLARAYADVTEDAARLQAVIARLRPLHAAEVIDDWLEQARAGAFADLAADLMRRHYDPRYEKHRARMDPSREATVTADRLDAAGIEALAADVEASVARLAGARPSL